jgi:hypothetical protein
MDPVMTAIGTVWTLTCLFDFDTVQTGATAPTFFLEQIAVLWKGWEMYVDAENKN